MRSVTTIYKVYGRDEKDKPILYAEFFDLKEACRCAVRNQGKIHYGLPEVVKHSYIYDQSIGKVEDYCEHLEPARIHYMNRI